MDIKNKKAIIFDLDDTLYKEVSFVKSSFLEIAAKISTYIDVETATVYIEMLQLFSNKKNVFKTILDKYSTKLSLEDLISLYRNHIPDLTLAVDKREILNKISKEKMLIGLLTDGRSVQQRNKIAALGIEKYLNKIVISEEFGTEKPSEKNYLVFQDVFKVDEYVYIADNTKKDFVSPNKLGWDTICLLDNGLNIHAQDFSLPKEYLPKYCVKDFEELEGLIFNS